MSKCFVIENETPDESVERLLNELKPLIQKALTEGKGIIMMVQKQLEEGSENSETTGVVIEFKDSVKNASELNKE